MVIKGSEFVKRIFEGFEVAGEIIVVAMKPRQTLSGAFYQFEKKQLRRCREKISKETAKKFNNSFYYLRKKGLINIEYRGSQMFFSLTEKGKKRAGKYKINDLKIEAAADWDKKWRVLIFDIEDKHKSKREALRGKIKELGLYQLQKSVWVCPYEFKRQMELLRDFFGLESKEMKVITAFEIEDDNQIRQFFNLK